jgi:hypothetical protein
MTDMLARAVSSVEGRLVKCLARRELNSRPDVARPARPDHGSPPEAR